MSPLFIVLMSDVRRKANSFDMNECPIKMHLLFAILRKRHDRVNAEVKHSHPHFDSINDGAG